MSTSHNGQEGVPDGGGLNSTEEDVNEDHMEESDDVYEDTVVVANERSNESGIVSTTEYTKMDDIASDRTAPYSYVQEAKTWVSRTLIRRDCDISRKDGEVWSGVNQCLLLEVEFGKRDGYIRSWSVRLIEDGKGKQSLRNVDPRDRCDIDCERYPMRYINDVVGEWAETRESMIREADDVAMFKVCKDIAFREKEREMNSKRKRDELEKSFIETLTTTPNVKDQGEGKKNK